MKDNKKSVWIKYIEKLSRVFNKRLNASSVIADYEREKEEEKNKKRGSHGKKKK